jgi:hypothetical protein
MRTSYVLGFLPLCLLWGILLYQLSSAKLLSRDWGVWTTRKERPIVYWVVVVVQGLAILLGSVFFIRDVLSLK